MLSRIPRRYLEPSTAKYTAAQNLDPYASVFGVKRRNQLDFHQEAMCKQSQSVSCSLGSQLVYKLRKQRTAMYRGKIPIVDVGERSLQIGVTP